MEQILEKKKYSSEVKSLLLSMLYNIENFYNDYAKVKVNVIKKSDFIEKLLYILKYECRNIIFKKREENDSLYDNINIDTEYEVIETYANEKILLYTLFKLDEYSLKMLNDDDFWKKVLIDFLEVAVPMDTIEILRDFNGWVWESSNEEILNYTYNMVYQSLKILIEDDSGIEITRKYNLKKIIDMLNDKYELKNSHDYLKNLKKLLIAEYNKENIIKYEKLFIEAFLKCFKYKIVKCDTKDSLYKCICEFRYFLLLPYNREECLKDVKSYEKVFDEIKGFLIDRCMQLKEIKSISKNQEENIQLFKYIFETRIINLKKVFVQVIKKEKKFFVNFYDSKILDCSFEINPVKVKLKKKYKVF